MFSISHNGTVLVNPNLKAPDKSSSRPDLINFFAQTTSNTFIEYNKINLKLTNAVHESN